MEIKVLGPGCTKCQQAEKVVREAVAEAGVAADVEKVTDLPPRCLAALRLTRREQRQRVLAP